MPEGRLTFRFSVVGLDISPLFVSDGQMDALFAKQKEKIVYGEKVSTVY